MIKEIRTEIVCYDIWENKEVSQKLKKKIVNPYLAGSGSSA